MERLEVTDGFDVHEYRNSLKLIREERETMLLANRDSLACPACGEAFDRLYISEKRTNTFGAPGGPFCIVRTDEQVLLLTH